MAVRVWEPAVKVASGVLVVPAELVATSRKWYVVPAVSPEIGADTGTGALPDPALVAAVLVPYAVFVPYSK